MVPTAYRKTPDGRIVAGQVDFNGPDDTVVWIDALNPTDDELLGLDAIMGFEVPKRHEITDIELSSRLYKDNGALVMIANLLPKSALKISPPRPAAFILSRNLLLTIRYSEFFSFERISIEVPKTSAIQTPMAIFSRLLEEAVADRADNIELSMRHMEELSSLLFLNHIGDKNHTPPGNPELDTVLRRIGGMGEGVSNIRESIASLQRVLNFAKTYAPDDWMGEHKIVLESLKTDLTALSDEAAFFMNRLSFILDATLGMINMEETKIIRVLSIVTLLLSPPMLIAGIYGMNFSIMPELTWPFGYLFSLGLMTGSAAASIWYLKRKHWM